MGSKSLNSRPAQIYWSLNSDPLQEHIFLIYKFLFKGNILVVCEYRSNDEGSQWSEVSLS